MQYIAKRIHNTNQTRLYLLPWLVGVSAFYIISIIVSNLFMYTFLCDCLSQAEGEKKCGTVLVGKVMFPCARGKEQAHSLVLSQHQLQRVHHLLMT